MAPTPMSSAASPREHDGDDRHQGLGKSRAQRREDAARGAFAELVATAEPLDAVGEQLGRGEDDGERDEQQEVGNGGGKNRRRAGRLRRPALRFTPCG